MNEKSEALGVSREAGENAIPHDGWKFAPPEPTAEMVRAGWEDGDTLHKLVDAALARGGWPYSCRESADACSEIYRRMAAEAPAVSDDALLALALDHPLETTMLPAQRAAALARGRERYAAFLAVMERTGAPT